MSESDFQIQNGDGTGSLLSSLDDADISAIHTRLGVKPDESAVLLAGADRDNSSDSDSDRGSAPAGSVADDEDGEDELEDEEGETEGEDDAGESGDDTQTETLDESTQPVQSHPESDASSLDPELAQWREFKSYLAANPAVAAQIQAVIEGRVNYTPPPPQTPSHSPEPPADLDLEDPVIKALWDQHVATQQEIQRLRQDQISAETRWQQETIARQEAIVNRAKASFAKQKSLSSEEIDHLERVAVNLNVVPALARGVDPITGEARKTDPLSVMDRALEIAYYSDPKFRDREIQNEISTRQQEQRKSKTRKQKLSSLGGSSGNTPRPSPQAPTSYDAIRRMAGAMFENE